MKPRDLIQSLKVIIIALVLGLGLSYVNAAWVGPTALPPSSNVASPLNVSSTSQFKPGPFGVGGLLIAYAGLQLGNTPITPGASCSPANVLAVDTSGSLNACKGGVWSSITEGVPPLTNGVCGSANGTAYVSAPSSNLCSVGTASAVSGSGPWTWTCSGLSGGTNASCNAPLSSSYIAATGGTITTDGNYKVHTFTSGGTFTVTSAPAGATVQVLVVAGGGVHTLL